MLASKIIKQDTEIKQLLRHIYCSPLKKVQINPQQSVAFFFFFSAEI